MAVDLSLFFRLMGRFTMLRTIRRNAFINKLVRRMLVKLGNYSSVVRRQLLPRWRVSGKIPLTVRDISFYMWSDCDDMIVDGIYYGWNDEELETLLFVEF